MQHTTPWSPGSLLEQSAPRVLVLQHSPIAPLGIWKTMLEVSGIGYEILRIDEQMAWPNNMPPAAYDAVIALGGPQHVYEENTYSFFAQERAFLHRVIEEEVPYLGICLGAQMLAAVVGASVHKHTQAELGWTQVYLTEEGSDDPLFSHLPEVLNVYAWHEDAFALSPGAVLLASNRHTPHQAFRVGRYAYGLQFHMELHAAIIEQWLRLPEMQAQARAVLGDEGPRLLSWQSEPALRIYQAQSRQLLANFLQMAEQRREQVAA